MKNQFVSIWLLFCFPILLAASAVASEKNSTRSVQQGLSRIPQRKGAGILTC